MGLGKTITCVSLMAATLNSSLEFAATPLTVPEPPPDVHSAPMLSADHFAGAVWGMPAPAQQPTSAKAKAKQNRDQDKMEAEYTRACRIKRRSRATLIVCPLSTVVNWEDQFREHWQGEVYVVGGAGGGSCPGTTAPSSSGCPTLKNGVAESSVVTNGKLADEKFSRVREGRPLRVYVYHGNARRPEPAFLADFDAVITTYSTLASEFSKQTKSLASTEEDEEENASDHIYEVDEHGHPIIQLPQAKKPGPKKRKKTANGTEATSPLQSIHWFRVVLDEAQYVRHTILYLAC